LIRDSPIGKIALHFARSLADSVRAPVAQARSWSIQERDGGPLPSQITAFLKSPCNVEYDYQLAKKQPKAFLQLLSPYMRTGEIRVYAHQPRSHWVLTIKKLKNTLVDPTTLGSCSCQSSGRNDSSRHNSVAGGCLRQAYQLGLQRKDKDSKMLTSILAVLPEAVASEIRSKKRKTSESRSFTFLVVKIVCVLSCFTLDQANFQFIDLKGSFMRIRQSLPSLCRLSF
jgi:hypothetical protein